MQQTEIQQYLNSKSEAILYVIHHHPELPYPEKKMQLYDECCKMIGERIDPELVFRVARKHNEQQLHITQRAGDIIMRNYAWGL